VEVNVIFTVDVDVNKSFLSAVSIRTALDVIMKLGISIAFV
jgi:hypothetical protein